MKPTKADLIDRVAWLESRVSLLESYLRVMERSGWSSRSEEPACPACDQTEGHSPKCIYSVHPELVNHALRNGPCQP